MSTIKFSLYKSFLLMPVQEIFDKKFLDLILVGEYLILVAVYLILCQYHYLRNFGFLLSGPADSLLRLRFLASADFAILSYNLLLLLDPLLIFFE